MSSTSTERPAPLGQPPSAGVRYALRRLILAAVMALSAALLLPAAASAQSSEQDSSAYVGTWTGRSGAMTLNSDGTGYLTISNESTGGDAWSLEWSTLPGSIVIELQTRAILDGTGFRGNLAPGTWWYADLQQSGGVTVLRLVDPPGGSGLGTYWCNPQAYGTTTACSS